MKASVHDGCFLSWRTETDSNLIPAQISCRQRSLWLGKLLLIHECDLIRKAEEKFTSLSGSFPFIFWNYWLFYQFCATNNRQTEQNARMYCILSSIKPIYLLSLWLLSFRDTGPPWAQSKHTLVDNDSTSQPVGTHIQASDWGKWNIRKGKVKYF